MGDGGHDAVRGEVGHPVRWDLGRPVGLDLGQAVRRVAVTGVGRRPAGAAVLGLVDEAVGEDVLVEVEHHVVVAGQQLVPGQGARLVEGAAAGQVARLPHPEVGAPRVDRDHGACQRPDLDGAAEGASPVGGDGLRCDGDVADAKVGRPLARHRGGRGPAADSGDGLVREQRHGVAPAGRVARQPAPAEQLGVEVLGPVDVADQEVHPAGGPIGVVRNGHVEVSHAIRGAPSPAFP